MAQRDWKFHDYDMLLDRSVREGKYYIFSPEAYRLTGLRKGSTCIVYRGRGDQWWTRRTKNEGSNGSVRYEKYETLQEALDAGIKWARRKDEEGAQ